MSKPALAIILALVVGFSAYQWALIQGYRDMNTRLVQSALEGCQKPSRWTEAMLQTEKSPGRDTAQGSSSDSTLEERTMRILVPRLAVRVQRRDGQESLRAPNLSTLEALPVMAR